MSAIQSDLKLLVIEDNPGDYILIEEYLAEVTETAGIEHVTSFQDAKSKLTGTPSYNAILLDLTLPDLSGEELIQKMVHKAGHIPIIVLTGYENQEFGLKTLSMGAADYVLKDEITPFILSKVIAYSIERNKIRRSLQQSESKYRDIFNLSPQPMFLTDVSTKTIKDVNEAAIDNYGYSRDEFIGLHLKDIRPDNEVSKLYDQLQKVDENSGQFFHTTLKHQRKNGEVFDVEISSSEIMLDGKPMRMAVAEDVTEKRQAEKKILEKTQLLAANAKVTSALIKTEDWFKALKETFEAIGEAIQVDRVYYFENHKDSQTGELLTSQKIEWSRDRIEPQINNPELQNVNMGDFDEHFPKLEKNEVYQSKVKNVGDLNLKKMLKEQDIVSILHFPIFVDDNFHGFIGFDDCKNERVWDDEEIQYLQTLGSNIASAIKLRKTTEELKVSEYKFKSMVEEGGDLVEILDKDGNFKFISPNLHKILGWSEDELLGENAFDYIHPADVEIAKQDFKALLNTQHYTGTPFRFKDKNGKWNWLKSSGTNLLDDEIINGIIITSSDITEQKYFTELQRLERDVLEKNALSKENIHDIVNSFLVGIESLHSGFRTSVCLVENNEINPYCFPKFSPSFADDFKGLEVGKKAGSCSASAYYKRPVIVPDIYDSPYWKGSTHLGEKYDFSASWSQPIFDSKGNVRATFAVFYDQKASPTKYEYNTIERAAHILRILFESEDKEKAEQQLALREKRFKALVHEGSDLIGILDENMRFKYVSPSVGGMYESYVGTKAADIVHPADLDRVQQSLQKLPDEKRVTVDPYRLRDHKGNYHWVETIFTNLLDEPAVEGYVANSRNVTQQIKREDKLKELSLVASKTTDAVVITDANGQITWVNKAFTDLTQYALEEIKGKKPGNVLQGPETNPETVQKMSEAISNNTSIETTVLNYNKEGSSYWLNLSIDPIFNDDNECTHYIAIERNVTEKIERERELQKSLERYDIVNKATSDTIWDLDIETDHMHYNSNIHNMFGYSKQQVKNVGEWWKEKIHPEDLEVVDNALSRVLKKGNDRFQMEYRFKAADGTYKYIFDRAFVIKDETGKPVRMIGAMQDITQEREEEERLKLLESVITNTSESVVILNANSGKNGREIVFVNEAFTQLTGYSKQEVIGKTLSFLNGPETDESIRERLRDSMKDFEPTEVQFINYKKNGEKIWINTSMVPVQDNNGNYTHWVAIGRDITEQKQNEEAIKASLSEKETLLAEIHHRVKNNLAVVSGMMQLQAFESTNRDLQAKLYDSVVRIKTMATVHELLYQSNSFSQLEFSDTLTKLVENISETLQTNTEISLDIDCDPIKLNINQAIPASLIVNEVITNAYKHAFKEKGTGKIMFNLSEHDNLIHIEIKDDGCGFADQDVMKSGSLGVHLINVLCEQLNGKLEYKNYSKGTIFDLQFERKEIKKGIGNAALN